MDIKIIKSKLRESGVFMKKEFSVEKIGVFGSHVRGEQKKK